MVKSSDSYFVVQFPLDTEPFQGHDMDDYKKKKLSQRWTVINGFKVQRDMYSAFLIMNMNEDLETFNKEKCNCKFNNFLILHNATVERLSDQHNLSSIAI